jgi:hypothetical protein
MLGLDDHQNEEGQRPLQDRVPAGADAGWP